MMDPILEPFAHRSSRVRLRAPEIPFVSNVTGTWITAGRGDRCPYWARHLRQTVRFADGLHRVAAGRRRRTAGGRPRPDLEHAAAASTQRRPVTGRRPVAAPSPRAADPISQFMLEDTRPAVAGRLRRSTGRVLQPRAPPARAAADLSVRAAALLGRAEEAARRVGGPASGRHRPDR